MTTEEKWANAVNDQKVFDRVLRLNKRLLKEGESPPKPDPNLVDYIRRGDVLKPPVEEDWAPRAFQVLAEFGSWKRDELRRCSKHTFRAMPYDLESQASRGVKQWPRDVLQAMVAGSFSLEGGQNNPKKGAHEQWWTLRCQVCGAGVQCSTHLSPSEFDVRGMTLHYLVRCDAGGVPGP